MEDFPKYNRIAEVLKNGGRSQKWLAERVGVSVNTINNWCKQKLQPPLDRLFEMKTILGLDSVTDLINTDYKAERNDKPPKGKGTDPSTPANSG